MTKEEILKEVGKYQWMHTIDLGNGVVTPGKWPRNQDIIKAFDTIDFTGKKVLDIGTCNGIWSFEAEKRGASVVHSIDYLTHAGYWCKPAYDFAHQTLESKALYNPDLNVYDIESLGIKDFDVVVFCGIYYHLKHPLLALANIRKVMRPNAKIIIEGPIYPDEDRSFATFHYHDLLFGDRSNWWTPSKRCLREWVESSFFDITHEFEKPGVNDNLIGKLKRVAKQVLGRDVTEIKRIVMAAEAVTRKDELYPSVDDDIIDFMES